MNISDVKVGTVIRIEPNRPSLQNAEELRKTVVSGSNLVMTNNFQYEFYHNRTFHSLNSYAEVDGTLPDFTMIA